MATTTMRAVTQDVLGGPEVLKVTELARPEPGISQVLIRVRAAGVAAKAARRGIRAQLMLAEADRAGMNAIADLVTQGKLRPVIAGTFRLADAAGAHALGDTGHVAGKLVLTMR